MEQRKYHRQQLVEHPCCRSYFSRVLERCVMAVHVRGRLFNDCHRAPVYCAVFPWPDLTVKALKTALVDERNQIHPSKDSRTNQSHWNRPIVSRVPRVCHVVATDPYMTFRYKDMLCRRCFQTTWINTDYIAWKPNDTFADNSSWMNRWSKNDEISSSKSGRVEAEAEFVLNNYVPTISECWQHRRAAHLKTVQVGSRLWVDSTYKRYSPNVFQEKVSKTCIIHQLLRRRETY